MRREAVSCWFSYSNWLMIHSIFTEEPGKAKRIITGSAVRTTKCHYVDLLYFVQCALPKNLAIKHRAYSSMPNAMQRLKSSLV